MDVFIIVLAVLVALGIGIGTGFFFRASILGRRMKDAGEEASRILEEAEEQRKRALLEAKEEALGVRTAAESDLRERRSELQNQERRLANREENIERRSDNLDKREKSQVGREKELDESLSALSGNPPVSHIASNQDTISSAAAEILNAAQRLRSKG